MERNHNKFDVVVTPDSSGQGRRWKELWAYRSMIGQLVHRQFTANYKQTILGPAWAVIQPLVSTLITALVFGGLAGLSPEGIPMFLFYMSGQVVWNFFSACLGGVSGTFVNNAHIMGKVYFPRFAMPIAHIMGCGISLVIQSALFAGFYVYFVLTGSGIALHGSAALLPFYLLHLAVLGIGVGAILSAITIKYRDTQFLIGYGTMLWMYLSPVVYDIGIVPDRFLALYLLNPVTPVIQQMRYALFQQGAPCWGYYGISLVMTGILLVLGYRIFNRVERTFLDII